MAEKNRQENSEIGETMKIATLVESQGGFEHKDGWTWWNILHCAEESSVKSWAGGAEQALRAAGLIPSTEIVNAAVRELSKDKYVLVMGDASTSPYEENANQYADKLVEEILEKGER